MKLSNGDIASCVLYCMGFSAIRNMMLRKQHGAVCRFLVFHDVPPNAARSFIAYLRFLKKCTNVVSMDDFFSHRLSAREINTVITFDDGYKSWVTDVVPTLQNLRLPATFFISSGFVGLSEDDEAAFAKTKLFRKLGPRNISGGLSFDDVRIIAKEGFSIGGHTINHCNLSALQDRDQIIYEIAEDKKQLEIVAGADVRYFSYPGGDWLNSEINIVQCLKELGYIGAVTTNGGFNHSNSNPYLLHREILSAATPAPIFRARLYGNYDAIMFWKTQLEKWR